jgi:hypothetical protein
MKNRVGVARDTYREVDWWVQGFGAETWGKEATWKA